MRRTSRLPSDVAIGCERRELPGLQRTSVLGLNNRYFGNFTGKPLQGLDLMYSVVVSGLAGGIRFGSY